MDFVVVFVLVLSSVGNGTVQLACGFLQRGGELEILCGWVGILLYVPIALRMF